MAHTHDVAPSPHHRHVHGITRDVKGHGAAELERNRLEMRHIATLRRRDVTSVGLCVAGCPHGASRTDAFRRIVRALRRRRTGHDHAGVQASAALASRRCSKPPPGSRIVRTWWKATCASTSAPTSSSSTVWPPRCRRCMGCSPVTGWRCSPPNRWEWVVAFWAITSVGALPVGVQRLVDGGRVRGRDRARRAEPAHRRLAAPRRGRRSSSTVPVLDLDDVGARARRSIAEPGRRPSTSPKTTRPC